MPTKYLPTECEALVYYPRMRATKRCGASINPEHESCKDYGLCEYHFDMLHRPFTAAVPTTIEAKYVK